MPASDWDRNEDGIKKGAIYHEKDGNKPRYRIMEELAGNGGTSNVYIALTCQNWGVQKPHFGAIFFTRFLDLPKLITLLALKGFSSKNGGPKTEQGQRANLDAPCQNNQKVIIKHITHQHWKLYLDKEVQGLHVLLKYPKIAIRVFDKSEQHRYIVLEYGESDLDKEIGGKKENPIPLKDAYQIITTVLEKVKYCHKRLKLVHRDLKPSNIFFLKKGDLDSIRIGDFGSSKLDDAEFRSKSSEARATTLPYTAPELLEDRAGDAKDPTLDVFSLGMLLYWLIKGDLDIPVEVEKMNLENQRNYFTQRNKQISKDCNWGTRKVGMDEQDLYQNLQEVTQKALSYKPEHRYQDAGKMLAAILKVSPFSNTLFRSRPKSGIPSSHDDEAKTEGRSTSLKKYLLTCPTTIKHKMQPHLPPKNLNKKWAIVFLFLTSSSCALISFLIAIRYWEFHLPMALSDWYPFIPKAFSLYIPFNLLCIPYTLFFNFVTFSIDEYNVFDSKNEKVMYGLAFVIFLIIFYILAYPRIIYIEPKYPENGARAYYAKEIIKRFTEGEFEAGKRHYDNKKSNAQGILLAWPTNDKTSKAEFEIGARIMEKYGAQMPINELDKANLLDMLATIETNQDIGKESIEKIKTFLELGDKTLITDIYNPNPTSTTVKPVKTPTGTHYDASNKLLWYIVPKDQTQLNYEKILKNRNQLNIDEYKGISNWQLPSVEQLQSIFSGNQQDDENCSNPINAPCEIEGLENYTVYFVTQETQPYQQMVKVVDPKNPNETIWHDDQGPFNYTFVAPYQNIQ